ncbi:MAG: sulfatase-like hydrolase/transferase [Candidatus Hydrogenedentes bacterium]|nr:sulfatase-like hydrolase/transferase [Candidatus Hydrogenedentota bacterium]
MQKKLIGTFVKLTVTSGLFILLFRPHTFGLRPDLFGGVTPAKMLAELGQAQAHNLVPWLLFATLIKLCGIMCGVFRWRLLLQGQGLRIPFWYLVQSWFVGRYIGIFLPSTIGLDGYRLYDSIKYTGDIVRPTVVIAVEKLIGVIALTFLVFVTFPLGFRLVHMNVVILVVSLMFLGTLVMTAFLLLLNPRIIQVLVGVFPTPAPIASKLNKLGAAVTAYSGNRALLMKAVFLGLMVHVASCLVYFGTMMALRAENTTLTDILFASPLMIYGTVLGPSIGGEGIREIVFVTLLGATSGAAMAALIGHLGWWTGDVVPFLIGAPIFIFRSSSARREDLVDSVKTAMRRFAEGEGEHPQLSPETLLDYRTKLIDCLIACGLGGLIAGALLGLTEATWLVRFVGNLTELGAFWWGPAAYGVLFVAAGLAIAGVLAFAFLIFDRFFKPTTTFALTLGASLAAGLLIVGRFRFNRDILHEHGLSRMQDGAVLGISLVGGMVVAAILWIVISRVRTGRAKAVGIGVVCYLCLIGGGALWASIVKPKDSAAAFVPKTGASGPNVILIVADTLRADALRLYSGRARARTPSLEALAADGVLFQNGFAQASWTKASFATIFTGQYPEGHTATGKQSQLPADRDTLAELLSEKGYFTKGFSNNGNISKTFNFQQGFVDYTDLEPNRYFGATPSSAKMILYEVLRRVRGKIFKRMVVTDFYQPAESVSEVALGWLDKRGTAPNSPFFLFLHYMDPHDPYMDRTEPGIGYARRDMENPDPGKFLDKMRVAYDGEIEYMDQHLGTLFDGLRQRGLYDGSIIVFTSDHGEEFFEHHGWWHGQTLYDEQIHIPLIIKLPANNQAGAVKTGFARHVDIAPTLLQLAGVSPSAKMNGKSLLGADNAPANADIPFVYAEEDFEGNVLQAARTTSAKVIQANPDNPRKLAPVELYDVEADPGEQNNLAGKSDPREPELLGTISEMQALIKQGAAESVETDIPPELQEQIKGIGYLQ